MPTSRAKNTRFLSVSDITGTVKGDVHSEMTYRLGGGASYSIVS